MIDNARSGSVTLSADELYRKACQYGFSEILNRLDHFAVYRDAHSNPLFAVSENTELFASIKGCWMKYKTDGLEREEFIYSTERGFIVGERANDPPLRYILHYEHNLLDVCEGWSQRTHWSIQGQDNLHDWPAMLMSKKKFEGILRRLDEMELDEITNKLTEISNDLEGSIALGRSLKYSKSRGDILFYANDEQHYELELHHVRFISHPSMNWLLRSSMQSHEDWLIASPTARNKFQDILARWLDIPRDKDRE